MKLIGLVQVKRLMIFIVCSVFVFQVQAQGKNKSSKVIMDEVSIIGNTELPNVTFDLPWKLPTVQKRNESQPLEVLDGMLISLDPNWHRRQIFFSQYLELEVPNYKVK